MEVEDSGSFDSEAASESGGILTLSLGSFFTRSLAISSSFELGNG